MIKRKQLFRHRPEDEIFGDCHRTAIACLLDKEPWEVPHFGHLYATVPDFNWRDHEEWYLRTQGYSRVSVCFTDIEEMFKFMHGWNPAALYMLGGESPRGTNHTVICCGGGFYWDPAKDGGFLVGPLQGEGIYEASFLVPVGMTIPLQE